MTTSPLPRVPQDVLDTVSDRIAGVRLPRLVPTAAAATGPAQDRQHSLLNRWRDGFDWRAIEDRVEALGYHETTLADGRTLAAIVARADKSTGAPILLIHGWPDSPLRFLDLIPLLLDAGHDVVAPAIPGFWYSTEPEGEMSRDLAAEDFHTLMGEVGYSRFAVHAGDWGSAVAQSIAQSHPDSVVALHLTDVPFDLAYTIDVTDCSPAEALYLTAIEKFGAGALYLTANTMQPNLIASVLADTPFGLAAWLGSLYDAWSDTPIADDHVIANAAVQYLTGTVRSSMRLYSEPAAGWGADESDWGTDESDWGADESGAGSWEGTAAETADAAGDWSDGGADWAPARVEIPTAFALFPADLAMAPRELAERFFAVERFTIMPRGGHFAALEEPALLADDIVGFLAQL